jgi:hypothetical protein
MEAKTIRFRNDSAVEQVLYIHRDAFNHRRITIKPGGVVEGEQFACHARPAGPLTAISESEKLVKQRVSMQDVRAFLVPHYEAVVRQSLRGRSLSETNSPAPLAAFLRAGTAFEAFIDTSRLAYVVNATSEDDSTPVTVGRCAAGVVRVEELDKPNTVEATPAFIAGIPACRDFWRPYVVHEQTRSLRRDGHHIREGMVYDPPPPPEFPAATMATQQLERWRELLRIHRRTLENWIGEAVLRAVRNCEEGRTL